MYEVNVVKRINDVFLQLLEHGTLVERVNRPNQWCVMLFVCLVFCRIGLCQ